MSGELRPCHRQGRSSQPSLQAKVAATGPSVRRVRNYTLWLIYPNLLLSLPYAIEPTPATRTLQTHFSCNRWIGTAHTFFHEQSLPSAPYSAAACPGSPRTAPA